MNSAPQSPAAPVRRCDILIIGAGPAGMAAALAAALQERASLRGQNVGLALTGGNVDAAVFAGVLAGRD